MLQLCDPEGRPRFTNMAVVGILPDLLNVYDPRPVKDQLNETYDHGGGWRPIKGFTLKAVAPGLPVESRDVLAKLTAHFPNDPPFREVSRTIMGDELLVLFECDFMAIIQRDGSFEMARVD